MAANKWRGRQMFACILRNYGSWPVILYKRKAAYSLGMTAGDLADLIDPTCRDMGGSVPGVSAFECSRCGALLNVGDGGGLRVAGHYYDDTPNVSISYCPYCGARVIR